LYFLINLFAVLKVCKSKGPTFIFCFNCKLSIWSAKVPILFSKLPTAPAKSILNSSIILSVSVLNILVLVLWIFLKASAASSEVFASSTFLIFLASSSINLIALSADALSKAFNPVNSFKIFFSTSLTFPAFSATAICLLYSLSATDPFSTIPDLGIALLTSKAK
jgi:uncharacterized membrane protein